MVIIAVIMSDAPRWPALPLDAWRDTYATLHMWMQVVGKVCLALTPPTNHFWNIAFQITARGLTTPAMYADSRVLTMTFDFLDHQLVVQSSDGRTERIPLAPRTVAEFYRTVMETLRRLDVDVHIWPMPVEVPNPIRFARDDVHRSYDAAAACPSAAFSSTELNALFLPYGAVRTAASPGDELTAFLASTYDAAAALAGWNRAELERKALSV